VVEEDGFLAAVDERPMLDDEALGLTREDEDVVERIEEVDVVRLTADPTVLALAVREREVEEVEDVGAFLAVVLVPVVVLVPARAERAVAVADRMLEEDAVLLKPVLERELGGRREVDEAVEVFALVVVLPEETRCVEERPEDELVLVRVDVFVAVEGRTLVVPERRELEEDEPGLFFFTGFFSASSELDTLPLSNLAARFCTEGVFVTAFFFVGVDLDPGRTREVVLAEEVEVEGVGFFLERPVEPGAVARFADVFLTVEVLFLAARLEVEEEGLTR